MKLRAIAIPRIGALAFFVARSLGPTGWIGVGALIIAANILWAAVPDIEERNAQEARELSVMERQWQQLRNPRTAHAQRDPLAGLIESLPPVSAVPNFLADLQRRADQAAVQIDRTEYRIQPAIDKAAQRYFISFPAHVDYPHLRGWLEALLHDYPSLALDELSLRREVDGGEELEARISLSFLVRGSK